MEKISRKLIVGLGNPGKEYELMRHSIGRRAAAAFVEASEAGPDWTGSKKLNADFVEMDPSAAKFVIAIPRVFMNESGKAVKQLSKYFGVEPRHILVLHDDADIIFGKLKLSFGSRSAGHRGAESVIRALGTKDFWRLRIGIQPVAAERHIRAEELVLQPFSSAEAAKLSDIVETAIGAIRAWIAEPKSKLT